jgi:hypothetical protein
MTPVPNVINLFFQFTNIHNKLEILVSSKPIQSSLMFVGKARGLPQSGAAERCFTWVG